MPIIRFILIALAVYLIVRSFLRHEINAAQNNNQKFKEEKIKFGEKKISKSVGEYIDYEEMDKKNYKAD